MVRSKSANTKAPRPNVATARFKPLVPRPKGLPKRVQHGGRTIMTREEWRQCVEIYVKTKSYPSSKEKHELASQLNRCPKQLSIWFGNRRQDVVRAKDNGVNLSTEESIRKLLWSKWRVQERNDSEATYDSGMTDAMSELTRASSIEVSDSSVSEAATPAPENIVGSIRTDPLLMLLEAARMLDAEDDQSRELCSTLLGLSCA